MSNELFQHKVKVSVYIFYSVTVTE